ncbi:peptidase M28 [Emticicia oligotrophica DSM 17448]|uniref:Peptidase M28 n=1 Tax=Emticicia oligotrophica (strain DSM 17448 / CIP 109782 / MTCC 6937 / GPTSA100-15) TaxID=929562 RepID=A0ABM5N3K2_EMTOG|nr:MULTISPECIES: M20/M25/M40 family metallo-hydrolase [Emticicia]AFK03910.1 peptidase M28 [Emticicia oligotrophica DSM 17448]
MTAKQIVEQLTSFPNRGVATPNETPVLEFLSSLFTNQHLSKESFRTPKTYISVVWWLILGISGGLICLNFSTIIGLIIVFIFVTMSLLYFNWYASPVTSFPPLVTSHNLVVKNQNSSKPKKLILMAHWDTAPISLLYRPEIVGNFRKSLKTSLILMMIAQFLAISQFLLPNNFLLLISNVLALYFLIQGITASIDFFRLGYSNGASDNATGVAAAIETARKLWRKNLENLDVELVLTGAEEVGMIGARAYMKAHYETFTKETYLINFDTLGSGDLKIITQTGSWGNIVYDNDLVKIATEITQNNSALQEVKTGAWHTADFDSVWFQRAGIPSVTLAALNKNGRMPNIHRPTDILANVDFKPMEKAIMLAEVIGIQLNNPKHES